MREEVKKTLVDWESQVKEKRNLKGSELLYTRSRGKVEHPLAKLKIFDILPSVQDQIIIH